MALDDRFVCTIHLEQSTILFPVGDPWTQALGYAPNTLHAYSSFLQHFTQTLVDRDDRDTVFRALSLQNLRDSFAQGQPVLRLDVCIRGFSTGEYEWHHINIIAPQNGICQATIQSVAAARKRELDLVYAAERDSLTNFLNRTAFETHVNHILNVAPASALFVILDIDNFKQINDTLGHKAGDEALLHLAAHLRETLPQSAVVGRFGGDEFQIFIPGMQGTACTALCKRLLQVSQPCQHPLLTISIGAVETPQYGETLSECLLLADRALYAAKRKGKNCFSLYSAALDREVLHPQRKRFPKRRKFFLAKRFAAAISLLALCCTALLFIVHLTFAQYRENLHQQASEYLTEISYQVSTSTAAKLNTYTLQFRTAVSALTADKSVDSLRTMDVLFTTILSDFPADAIAYLSTNDTWMSGGKAQAIPFAASQAKACAQTQESYCTQPVQYNGQDYLALIVPASFTITDGTQFYAVAALFSPEDLAVALDIHAFTENGFAEVVTADGSVVLRSGQGPTVLNGNNLITALQTLAPQFVETVAQNILHEHSGQLRYTFENVEYLSLYIPLGYQNWTLYLTMPAQTVEARTAAAFRVALMFSFTIAMLFATLLLIIVVQQVRNRRKLEAALYYDTITQGSTRAKFLKASAHILAHSVSYYDDAYYMIYVNIDGFKIVNDRLGTSVADELLRTVLQCTQTLLNECDCMCRLSADHFAILYRAETQEDFTQLLKNITAAANRSSFAAEYHYTISLRFGVYLIENPDLPISVLIDRAHLALQEARNNAKKIGFYDAALRERLLYERRLEDSMETALENGEFVPFLQPKFHASTRKIQGFEALVRWQSAHHGQMQPGQFIPLFERNGFISKVDLSVFRQVCALQQDRQDCGRALVPISINLSRAHLKDASAMDAFLQIFRCYSIPASCLEFEFTESLFYDDNSALNQVIDRLHHEGFLCSMDDFGSGYSSLNMLHETAVDILKIDAHFLSDGAVLGQRSRKILSSVITLARDLNLQTVAEGVEYESQAKFLQECGCDLLQGFYFAKPMPVQDAISLWDTLSQP